MAEANLYITVKVAREEDLVEQIGRDIYFDLVDHNKVRSFRIKRQTPFNLFKEEVAKEFGIPVQFQRFWLWAKRQNYTYRPHRQLTPQQEAEPVGHLREPVQKVNAAELNLFLEVELGRDLRPIRPPVQSADNILLFFKLYDPLKEELRYVGRFYVRAGGIPVDILAKINWLAGFAPDEEIELYEEIKSEPIVMIVPVDKMVTFRGSQLEDGDIICFQKSPQVGSTSQCEHPDVCSFLEYVHRHQVVRFRSLEKPKEDEFSLELSKVHNYDDVVERVASHLGLDDPSKIRLTSHNCYSQQPKPEPIKYRGVEHLSDMLVHYNQTSDILYYEVLDIPLPELQGLKSLKVAFHSSSKDEVVNHTIRLPKQSTVRDLLNDLKTKVELSHPKAELRLLEIFYHKIYKVFPVDEKIENLDDQYWILRTEEIPEEEKNLGPLDRLIHVYHFKTDAAQNQENFGEPFLLVIHEGETLAEVKVCIQKRLQVPDEEFSKWKFASFSLGRHEYLVDSDIVSNRIQEVHGVWQQYLGLEHSDNQLYQSVPKKSYAANQASEHVPFEPAYFVNASNRVPNDATYEPNNFVNASYRASNNATSDPNNFVNSPTRASNDATPPAGKVGFLSYWVSSEASVLLEKIHGLHKDTFVKFSVTSRFMQTGVLESFALFVESMLTTEVNEVNEEALHQAFISVKEFEQVGLDLSWLKQRLEEVKLVNKLSESLIFVESCESSLKLARAKVRELKEVLARAKAELEVMWMESPKSLGVNDPILEGVL